MNSNLSFVLFSPGQILVTAKVKKMFSEDELWACLVRHMNGNWGDVSKEVENDNNQALVREEPIVSIYNFNDGRALQILTDDDRKTTHLMLPGDY